MASADQVKALLKSHIEGDDRRFFSVAMQVAASSARKGHTNVAEELRNIIDKGKDKRSRDLNRYTSQVDSNGHLFDDLFETRSPDNRLKDMVLSSKLEDDLRWVIREQYNLSKIKENNLEPRRKLLLVGPPGCGKTMSAECLAGELGLPLFTIRIDGIISKYMGESISKIKTIFDFVGENRGVYLFDEFDSIGGERSKSDDIGEIRRVLSTFLMLIERDKSNSLILAATNHPSGLDKALYRRFDDIIEYPLPDKQSAKDLLRRKVGKLGEKSNVDLDILSEKSEGLSFAEISNACNEALKEYILEGRSKLRTEDIVSPLEDMEEFKSKNS